MSKEVHSNQFSSHQLTSVSCLWIQPIHGNFFSFRLQEKIKQKRMEREEEDKKQNIALEKKRREQGKDMIVAKEK